MVEDMVVDHMVAKIQEGRQPMFCTSRLLI